MPSRHLSPDHNPIFSLSGSICFQVPLRPRLGVLQGPLGGVVGSGGRGGKASRKEGCEMLISSPLSPLGSEPG